MMQHIYEVIGVSLCCGSFPAQHAHMGRHSSSLKFAQLCFHLTMAMTHLKL